MAGRTVFGTDGRTALPVCGGGASFRVASAAADLVSGCGYAPSARTSTGAKRASTNRAASSTALSMPETSTR